MLDCLTATIGPFDIIEEKPKMTNDFDIKEARAGLIALRVHYGADSPVGYRASNLIEQLQNLEGATGEQRAGLLKAIGQSISEIEGLQR